MSSSCSPHYVRAVSPVCYGLSWCPLVPVPGLAIRQLLTLTLNLCQPLSTALLWSAILHPNLHFPSVTAQLGMGRQRGETWYTVLHHLTCAQLAPAHSVANIVSLYSCIIPVKLFNLKNNQLSLYQTECQVAIMTSLENISSIPVCDEKR